VGEAPHATGIRSVQDFLGHRRIKTNQIDTLCRTVAAKAFQLDAQPGLAPGPYTWLAIYFGLVLTSYYDNLFPTYTTQAGRPAAPLQRIQP
jgi:hypothetical protein